MQLPTATNDWDVPVTDVVEEAIPSDGPAATWERQRRSAMTVIAGGGLTAVLAGCGSGGEKPGGSGEAVRMRPAEAAVQVSDFGSGDIGILNYALTLEYFESDFYNKVQKSGVIKGRAAPLFASITKHESVHVAALEKTVKKLGGKLAPRVEAVFPLRNEREVVQFASTLENIGASAYLGQANRLKSKELLSSALAIHAIEARHAAVLNTLVGNSITPDGAFARGSDMDTVLRLATPFMQMAKSSQ